MATSNYRITNYDTVHHLVSRIAHRVYFIEDEEKDELLQIVRRSADFCGIQLVSWCLMTNHFHLLAYLPEPRPIDESEVLRRYGVLKGAAAGRITGEMLSNWRKLGLESKVTEWLDNQRRRMYDIGEFMKIVKQWFSMSYNRRHEHVGTLWEGPYRDHVISQEGDAMRTVMGYQHLNPIRATLCVGFAEYKWSSMTACKKGDPVAIAGLRFAYGDYETDTSELISQHYALLDEMLEAEKLKRALEIARKRAEGFNFSPDPLTTEAMVAQQAKHIETVQNALMESHVEDRIVARTKDTVKEGASKLLSAIQLYPQADASFLAKTLGVSIRTVQLRLKVLQKQGAITRTSRKAHWTIVQTFAR